MATRGYQLVAEVPDWLANSAQALAYWVAWHRHARAEYTLPEAALVAEFFDLLHRHAPAGQRVLPEYRYEYLPGNPAATGSGRRAAIDIAVGTPDPAHADRLAAVSWCIEVKRWLAEGSWSTTGGVRSDLIKLSQARVGPATWTGIVVVVAQGIRAERLQEHENDDGGTGTNQWVYRVRTTKRAQPHPKANDATVYVLQATDAP